MWIENTAQRRNALLKLTNDLLSSGTGLLTILLHITAAFETIIQSILLSPLESVSSVASTTLHSFPCFKSYLSDQHCWIHIDSYQVDLLLVSQGIPHGAVLGPLLFPLYMCPLCHIISQHGLHCAAFYPIVIKCVRGFRKVFLQ